MPTPLSREDTLLALGEEHGIWTDMRTCAEVIEEKNYDKFRRDLRSGLESRREEIRRKLELALSTKEIDIQTPVTQKQVPSDFRGIFYTGRYLGLWKTYDDCAAGIGMYPGTVSKYTNTPADELKTTPRGVAEYEEALEKIHKKVYSAWKHARVKERNANKGKATEPSETGRMDETPSATIVHGENTSDRPLTAAHVPDAAAIGEAVFQKFEAMLRQNLPSVVRPSNWRDELIAGNLEIAQVDTTSLRFLLHAAGIPNAPTLSGAEMGDTKEMLKKA